MAALVVAATVEVTATETDAVAATGQEATSTATKVEAAAETII